jgi:hypothetical protein
MKTEERDSGQKQSLHGDRTAGGEKLLTGVEQLGATVHDSTSALHRELEETKANSLATKTGSEMGRGRRTASNGGWR